MNSAQRRYTTTKRELLGIVKILEEFKTILLGYEMSILIIKIVHETTIMSSTGG